MRDGNGNGMGMPIPGSAGAAIHQLLKAMALHPGEMEITIRKERTAGGGYAYAIAKHQPTT
jgi:hypothetical protein